MLKILFYFIFTEYEFKSLFKFVMNEILLIYNYKMSNLRNYENLQIIHSGPHGKIYKAKNKENKNIVCIKEIRKIGDSVNSEYLEQIKTIKSLKSENSVPIIEIIDTKEYLYIIMELCLINIEDYLNMREEGLSIEEIREILIQINNILKIMNDNKITFRNLKLSNILISLDQINKVSIKISCINNNNNNIESSRTKISLTKAPEIIESDNIDIKSDLWSLGIIIYYMLFKEYPYNGRTEVQLLNDINSGKILKETNDNELNDLLKKMICIDLNNRISWEEYFKNPFFKNEDRIKNPEFQFNCELHSKIVIGYCVDCQKNICEECYYEHHNHKYIPFNKIGINEEEINKTENLISDLEKNIQNINEMKENIILFVNQIKNIKDNILIYGNDEKNNFKNYYIEYLRLMKNKTKFEEKLNIIDLNISNILEEHEIIEIEL